jgi:hypothetical protein
MVHAEPHRNKKMNEEFDVQVVTLGGVKTGMDFQHGENSGQKLERKIREAVQPPPKFDVS